MSEPEIARRCKSCGAAIRARSAFCPQCGVALAEGSAADAPADIPVAAPPEGPQQQAATDSVPDVEAVAPPETMAATVGAEAPSMAETLAPVEARNENAAAQILPVENPPPANVVAPADVVAPNNAAAATDVAPADGVSGKRQRVVAAARERVDESVRPRAEKLRRASNVVLDEAAADPSLRFVLVATALIILSLLLLLLGRIL